MGQQGPRPFVTNPVAKGGGFMPTVLAILTSGRPSGFTSELLEAAVEGVEEFGGVDVELVHTHAYRFGPCTSCFECIRNPDAGCVLNDDMGGSGDLFAKLGAANGIIIADPVHNWGISASARLLVERCYPFTWTGQLKGVPAMSISCASNQGMHLLARRELCKYLFGMRALYIGGVAAHVAQFDSAIGSAHAMGLSLADAALHDTPEAREAWTDQEAFEHYARTAPWDPVEACIENLLGPEMDPSDTLMDAALRDGVIKRRDAVAEVRKAQAGFAETLRLRDAGEHDEAARAMARATAHWTRATWIEFLEDDVIGVKQPPAYRPTEEDGD